MFFSLKAFLVLSDRKKANIKIQKKKNIYIYIYTYIFLYMQTKGSKFARISIKLQNNKIFQLLLTLTSDIVTVVLVVMMIAM